MTKLNELTKTEIAKLATEKGITLSYKDENGKRQRFTKDELISKLESLNNESVKINKSSTYGNSVSNIIDELKKVSINDLSSYVIKKLKSINSLFELLEFKDKIFTTINSIKLTKSRQMKRTLSTQVNIVTMMFKQCEIKLGGVVNAN